jgi:hypothetical protein
MPVKPDPLYDQDYNCLLTDLVNGFPKDNGESEGSQMYVWDSATKELNSIFKKVFGAWYKL